MRFSKHLVKKVFAFFTSVGLIKQALLKGGCLPAI